MVSKRKKKNCWCFHNDYRFDNWKNRSLLSKDKKEVYFKKKGHTRATILFLKKPSLLNFQKGMMMGKHVYDHNENFPAAMQHFFKCECVVNQTNSSEKYDPVLSESSNPVVCRQTKHQGLIS